MSQWHALTSHKNFFSWLGGDVDCLQLCSGMLLNRWLLWLWTEWRRTWRSRTDWRLLLFHLVYFEARACLSQTDAWGKVWARSSVKTPRALRSAPRACRSAWTRSWLPRKRLVTAPGARRSYTSRLRQMTVSRRLLSSRNHRIETRQPGPSLHAHRNHVGLRTTYSQQRSFYTTARYFLVVLVSFGACVSDKSKGVLLKTG